MATVVQRATPRLQHAPNNLDQFNVPGPASPTTRDTEMFRPGRGSGCARTRARRPRVPPRSPGGRSGFVETSWGSCTQAADPNSSSMMTGENRTSTGHGQCVGSSEKMADSKDRFLWNAGSFGSWPSGPPRAENSGVKQTTRGGVWAGPRPGRESRRWRQWRLPGTVSRNLGQTATHGCGVHSGQNRGEKGRTIGRPSSWEDLRRPAGPGIEVARRPRATLNSGLGPPMNEIVPCGPATRSDAPLGCQLMQILSTGLDGR